jgi:hypothetical protein
MSSASSTERGATGRDSGFQPWHFYMLLSLAGATWAVIVSRDTHPAALVLLSAAIVAAGLVGATLHYAVVAFFAPSRVAPAPATGRTREFLQQEKALVLRSIKELEFDRAMGKVSDQDFAEIGGRLRARAMEIMQALDGTPSSGEAGAVFGARRNVPTTAPQDAGTDHRAPGTDDPPRTCPSCDAAVDADARFCKICGAKLS